MKNNIKSLDIKTKIRMSHLYQIKIFKNITTVTTQEWNGRDSDELHGLTEVSKQVQNGWRVTLRELKIDFSKEESQFAASYDAIEKAKNQNNLFAGCIIEVNYPSISEKVITENNTSTLNCRDIVLQEDEFDFEEEVVFAFVRKGMSIQTSFARKAKVSAPIKSNRKGHSIRGYAADMDSDDSQKDSEFYNYILEQFN